MNTMLSDRIERFILNQLRQQNTPVLVLKRKAVADLLECAPSQVTYVINTRFLPDQRFSVESRRGSGGFIRIAVRTKQPPEFSGEERKPEPDPAEEYLKKYVQLLMSSGAITMREFLMIRELMNMFMEHCPQEHREHAVKDAVGRISRIIKEGK